ncbi:MAG: tetratricopeptide repeat protein [Deltaproteobacteria bacterium]|nr:tetratricopeptide repeat protein [Deltaproteobacteria bacterium]
MRRMRAVMTAFWVGMSVLWLCPPGATAQDVNDLLFSGSDLHYQGKLTEAARDFSKAVSMDPKNEFARNQLGLILAKEEKFEQAFEQFSAVAKMSPDNTFARTWLGVLYLRQNAVDKAFQEFREILRLDPNNANAYYFIGVIYAVEHNFKQAVEYLRKAQKVGSDDPETHIRLAQAFAGLGMSYNAQLEYERALDLAPKSTKALNGLGWIFFNRGEAGKAIEIWQEALKISPKDPDARFNLAKVFNDQAYAAWQAKDMAKAKQLWQKTLQNEPDNKAAKYYLQKIK